MNLERGSRRIVLVVSLAIVLVGLGLTGRQVARIAAWTDDLEMMWKHDRCEQSLPWQEHWKGRRLDSFCLALADLHPYWHRRYPWLAPPAGSRTGDIAATVVVGLVVSLGLGAIPWGLLLLGRWILEGFSSADSPAGKTGGQEKQTAHPPDSPMSAAQEAPRYLPDECIDEIGRDVFRTALDEEAFVAEMEERLMAVLPEDYDVRDWDDEFRKAYRRLTAAPGAERLSPSTRAPRPEGPSAPTGLSQASHPSPPTRNEVKSPPVRSEPAPPYGPDRQTREDPRAGARAESGGRLGDGRAGGAPGDPESGGLEGADPGVAARGHGRAPRPALRPAPGRG